MNIAHILRRRSNAHPQYTSHPIEDPLEGEEYIPYGDRKFYAKREDP